MIEESTGKETATKVSAPEVHVDFSKIREMESLMTEMGSRIVAAETRATHAEACLAKKRAIVPANRGMSILVDEGPINSRKSL